MGPDHRPLILAHAGDGGVVALDSAGQPLRSVAEGAPLLLVVDRQGRPLEGPDAQHPLMMGLTRQGQGVLVDALGKELLGDDGRVGPCSCMLAAFRH